MEKTVYKGQFIEVREQEIDNHTWEKVFLPDSLVVFPITKDNEIIMIEESRPHEESPSRLKFVTGHIDHSEDPAIAANRELQEEIGLKAEKLEEILVHRSSGTVNSNFYYYLAQDLTESKLPNPDGEGTILAIKKIKIEVIKEMLASGELPWTLSTLGLLKILNLHV